MDKSLYLNLTLAVYRVTGIFLENEPLKFQIREKANEILANLLLINPEPSPLTEKKLLKDIEILDSYFKIAENQNWADSRNFLVLEKEYDKIGKTILGNFSGRGSNKKSLSVSNTDSLSVFDTDSLTFRQRKILDVLKERGKAQVGEFRKIFQEVSKREVSKRTLRRDFEFLITQGLVKKMGDQRNTFYSIRT